MRLQLRVLEHHNDDTMRVGQSFCIDEKEIEMMRSCVIQVYQKRLGIIEGDRMEDGFHKYYKSVKFVEADTLKMVRYIYPLTQYPIDILPERPDVPVSKPTDLFPRKTDNHEGLDVPPCNE